MNNCDGLFSGNNLRADVNLNSSTGWVSGGFITINTDTTKFDISAGSGYIVSGNNPAIKKRIFWDAKTAVIPTLIAITGTTFLFINEDGDVVQSTTFPDSPDVRDKIQIGSIIHSNNVNIDRTSDFTSTPLQNLASSLNDLQVALGAINVGINSNVFAGDPAGNLKFSKTSGRMVYMGIRNKTAPNTDPNHTINDPLVAPFMFFTWRDGIGGFNAIVADVVTAGVYDNNSGGASAPTDVLNTNQWVNHRLYLIPDLNFAILQYGQHQYNSDITAIAGQRIELHEQNPDVIGVPFRGFCTMRGGALDLSLIGDAIFTDANKLGIV